MICSSENRDRFIVQSLRSGRTLTPRGGKSQGQVTVAKLSPQAQDCTQDPDWQAAHARLVAYLNDTTRPGFHVGTITEDDLYGDDP
jgi:hypothetical protein